MPKLDRKAREYLLEQANWVVKSFLNSDHKEAKEVSAILKKTSLVLFDLQQHRDLPRMGRLLNATHASSMGHEDWDDFRKKVKTRTTQFERKFPDGDQQVDAWLYFLGWLHRLGRQKRLQV